MGGNNGWLINNRFANFPPRPEGMLSLLNDLEEAGKKNHRTNWNFDKILMIITKLHPKSSNTETDEIQFRNQEEELLIQNCLWKMEYNCESDKKNDEQGSGWDDDQLFTQHRLIVITNFENLKNLISFLP